MKKIVLFLLVLFSYSGNGGGGSYNNGFNQSNASDNNTGQGRIIISW